MPMPMPMDDENHDQFMERCHSEMNREYPDNDQRNAVCESQWSDKHESRAGAYGHILSLVACTPWAILPDRLAVILDLLSFRAAGGSLTADEIQMRIGAAAKPMVRQTNVVGVLPIHGVIIPRGNMLAESSGAVSVERLQAQFRALLADPAISAIVLDVDSPGGAVTGVDEFAAEMHRARGVKPMVAVASPMAASAAYWLATAADEMLVNPTGEVGSIGVFAAHEDVSALMGKAGVKVSLISAGKYKTEGSPYEPLTDEARAAIQERVDDYYDMFVAAVARNRGVNASDVRAGFGEGRVVGARKAKALGMVDGIGTLEDGIAKAARLAKAEMKAKAVLPIAAGLDLQRQRLGLSKRQAVK